jgi:hypothetical protein
LSQEAEVGMKWNVQRGWPKSSRRIIAVSVVSYG